MHMPSLTAPPMRLRGPRAPLRIGRRTGLTSAAALVAGAAAFGWPWLVAAGAAPFLLAIAPCVAMCAAGACMAGIGRSRPTAAAPHDPAGRSGTPVGATQGRPS